MPSVMQECHSFCYKTQNSSEMVLDSANGITKPATYGWVMRRIQEFLTIHLLYCGCYTCDLLCEINRMFFAERNLSSSTPRPLLSPRSKSCKDHEMTKKFGVFLSYWYFAFLPKPFRKTVLTDPEISYSTKGEIWVDWWVLLLGLHFQLETIPYTEK